jgi:hypothetical protein
LDPQVGRGAQPAPRGDVLDRIVGDLQQLLRAPDTLRRQPSQNGRAGGPLEVPSQRAGAHRRASREVRDGDRLIEMSRGPRHDRRKSVA